MAERINNPNVMTIEVGPTLIDPDGTTSTHKSKKYLTSDDVMPIFVIIDATDVSDIRGNYTFDQLRYAWSIGRAIITSCKRNSGVDDIIIHETSKSVGFNGVELAFFWEDIGIMLNSDGYSSLI